MNKVAIIISLILAMAVGLSGCVTINLPEPKSASPSEPAMLASQLEISDIRITGYHSTYDIGGNYDPDHLEATLSWETNVPCYWCFEVRPVGFYYPHSCGGYEKFDVSTPLQQQTVYSGPIVLKSGKLHVYVITVWDKEKNYVAESDTFWAPVVPKAPPPPAPAPKSKESED